MALASKAVRSILRMAGPSALIGRTTLLRSGIRDDFA